MFLKRVYSEICVIRVQIFILMSLLCEFVTFRRKKGLDGKILCGNLWANSLLWNKVEFESACIILVCGKGESIFIAGRIANKTQFLRPNRCVAAERTTEYELWQSASRQQNPRKPPRKRLDAGTACSRSWNFSAAASRIGKRTAQSGSRSLGTPVGRNGGSAVISCWKVVLKTVHWFARCWMTSRKNCSHQSKSQKNERFCRKNSIF